MAKWSASTLLMGSWLITAVVASRTTYATVAVILLVLAVLLVLCSLWLGAFRAPPAAVIAVMLATPLVCVVVPLVISASHSLFHSPLFTNVDHTWLLLPAVITGAIAVPLGLLALVRPRLALVSLGVTAVAFGGVVVGGTPRIDVWVILQDVAGGLLHGQNPYDMRFPDVPAGETSSCFNYLPSTFLLTAPGRWLFGDVRWAEVAWVLGAALLLCWHTRRREGVLLAVLVAGLPCTLLVVQQAWTEPMLLALLCLCAVAVDRGRWWWGVVAMGMALANKQHAVVLLPMLFLYKDFGPRRTLATCLVGAVVAAPWVLSDPVRFKACVVDFYLDEGAPASSLSVWRWLPGSWSLVGLLVGTCAATVLVVRRCTGGGGLLVGSGSVLMVFDLFNKQTFANQWWLAAALVVAGMAASSTSVRASGAVDSDRPRSGRARPLATGRVGLAVAARADHLVRHLQQPQHRDQPEPAEQVAHDRETEQAQPVRVTERRAGLQRGEAHQRRDDRVVDLAGAQQEAGRDRRHEPNAVRVGAVLQVRHQRDEHAAEQRQRERLPRDPQPDVEGRGLHGGGAQCRETGHHEPDDDPTARQVGHDRRHPQPDQPRHTAALGDHSDDGHQEVLGEQLAARQRQRHEPDGERETTQQRTARTVLDQQQRQHTDADVDTPEEPGGQQPQPGPAQPLLTLVQQPVEGVLRVLLGNVGRAHQGTAPFTVEEPI